MSDERVASGSPYEQTVGFSRAVRTGQHCAQPIMDRYGVPATVRASIGLYNTRDEIDAFVRALHTVREVFG